MDITKYINVFREMANTNDDTSHIGTVPQYPFLVVYMDALSANAHETLKEHLVSLWPPFAKEMTFLQISGHDDDGLLFADAEGKQMNMKQMMAGTIPPLFSVESHYPSVTRLRLYIILDTTGKTLEMFQKHLADAAELMRALHPYNVNTILFTLLDDVTGRKESARIRNFLFENRNQGCSVCLLSNRLFGSHVMGDWKTCWHAIGAAIAASDSSKHLASSFYTMPVTTIGYFREGKPIDEISRITVCCFVEHLQKAMSDSMGDTVLPGVTEGRLDVLDRFVDEQVNLLLSDEALRLMPRARMESISAADSFDRVNDLTLNTLEYLLQSKFEEILDAIRRENEMQPRDLAEQSRFGAAWLGMLKNMSFMDIMKLTSNIAGQEEKLVRRGASYSGMATGCRDVFRNRLRHMLASHDVVHTFFRRVLEAAREQNSGLYGAYTELMRSMSGLHRVRDEALEAYYRRLLMRYLEEHPLEADFGQFRSAEELDSFILRSLEKLIQSVPMYRYDLERERNERIYGDQDASARTTTMTLMQNVVEQNVNIMFPNYGTSLGNPREKAVFAVNDIVRNCELEGTAQDSMLKNTDINIYITGCKYCIDILYLYEVSDSALVAQEEV